MNLQDLPPELLVNIRSKLDRESTRNLARTSKLMRSVARSKPLKYETTRRFIKSILDDENIIFIDDNSAIDFLYTQLRKFEDLYLDQMPEEYNRNATIEILSNYLTEEIAPDFVNEFFDQDIRADPELYTNFNKGYTLVLSFILNSLKEMLLDDDYLPIQVEINTLYEILTDTYFDFLLTL